MNSLMPLDPFFKEKKACFTHFKDFAFTVCSSIEKI